MAVVKVLAWFSKPGKGFPQTPQVNADGTPELDPKTNQQVIGNEQYQAEQLTDESISHESAESFLEDVLESVSGDLETAAEMFRTGWNRVTRLRTGGLDEYQKAAKKVISLELPWAKGLSIDEVAEKLRNMS
jgi:hypothetical protein